MNAAHSSSFFVRSEVHFKASLRAPGVSVSYCILRNKRFRCFLIGRYKFICIYEPPDLCVCHALFPQAFLPWYSSGDEYASVLEVCVATILIVSFSMVLYENEVRTWAQNIVDDTPDYSDGGPSAQGPWSAPASWKRTGQSLVASVKRWLEGGSSKKRSVANPVVEVLRDDHGLTPRPFACMTPSSHCASACPWSAALRYQHSASL